MKLSESLSRDIIEVSAGSIINKFKLLKRRNTLFFEDILANYIKTCEDAGYGMEMQEIGRRWSSLLVQQFIPNELKQLSCSEFFNQILKPLWVNLGLIKNIRVVDKNNFIRVETEKEPISRIIGKNRFAIGFYAGQLNSFLNSSLKLVSAAQTKDNCTYVFEKTTNLLEAYQTKERYEYDKLNHLPELKGFSLKNALLNNLLYLKENNRMFFRGHSVWCAENTVFHLFGNANILLEKISDISYEYFSKLVGEDSSPKEKLRLLKSTLQVMGWGSIKISIKDKERTLVTIRYLPYGLQTEKDNWEVLIRTILGFLWTINKTFRIESVVGPNRRQIIITYRSH